MSPLLRLALLLLALLPLGTAHGETGPDHLSRVEASGEVRVCVWPDYYGISYRSPRTHELMGIDIDMAYALGKDLGVQVRFVESSFAKLIPDLLDDHCDIAMFGIGVIPTRTAHLRFTSPHLESDIYAITTRSNRLIRLWSDIDRPGVVVAVAKGTLHEPVMREMLQHAELKVLDTPFAREQEVESGRADVFMTDYPYSLKMLATTDWARLVKPEGVYRRTPYAYAVKPGDDRWFERVEAFVQQVKHDGRLLAAAKRHQLEPILHLD